MTQLKLGDPARLISVPDWLVHDLPLDERSEILACIGKTTVITEIDSHGYFWIGFGDTNESTDGAQYSGHSFCVTRECLEPVRDSKGSGSP